MTSFKDMQEMTVRPVGVVHASVLKPAFRPDIGDQAYEERIKEHRKSWKTLQTLESEVEIDPGLEGILDGIEDYSHILVIFWPHLIPEDRRSLKQVHPMGRKDMPIKGIYATCSPARPNPILVSAVRLLERKDNILRVQGLDAVDGSPILDIKPFTLSYPDYERVTVPAWLDQLHEDLEKEE
ncbi:MAG: tRNA (N6-threonylcarbamoyladenosine(37)-N6)-methyltransferase TrmO [Desulfatibacillum sp.]|nr:tRNA (N6-threonylcarbamoyladenosine(37)-N6)-methyltransferase TrmO [Desulfatibacillum sp.]